MQICQALLPALSLEMIGGAGPDSMRRDRVAEPNDNREIVHRTVHQTDARDVQQATGVEGDQNELDGSEEPESKRDAKALLLPSSSF